MAQIPAYSPGVSGAVAQAEQGDENLSVSNDEPSLPAVEHTELDWPAGLIQRIETLLHGISVDIPPEYDLYGYEIRRYMAHVGGLKVMRSPENIKGQIQNIDSAQKVLHRWQKQMQDRFMQIDEQIEAQNADSSTRTQYRYNKGIVLAFMTEAETWIRNNKMILEFLSLLSHDAYQVQDGKFSFRDKRDFEKFSALYDARERSLKQMKKYTPFRLMVY